MKSIPEPQCHLRNPATNVIDDSEFTEVRKSFEEKFGEKK